MEIARYGKCNRQGIMIGCMAALLVAGCGCTTICADVIANFTLTEVAYDSDEQQLFVCGFQALSYCDGCGEEADRYASFQLVYSISDQSITSEITGHHEKRIPQAPLLLHRLFAGEFGTRCSRCEIKMRTEDGSVEVAFFTMDSLLDRADEFERMPIMLMAVTAGEEAPVEIAIGYDSAEKVPTD